MPPRAKNVPRKQATSLEPCSPIWDVDFFVFTLEFHGKIILCLPNIVHVLFPLSGHATMAPRQAVRLINLACPSQEDKTYS